MVGSFEIWINVNDGDACLTGRYIASKGRKATRLSPEEPPEIDYADLLLEYSEGEEDNLVELTTEDGGLIDSLVDWDDVNDKVGTQVNEDAYRIKMEEY